MTTLDDLDLDAGELPTGIHELPPKIQVWAAKSALKHNQLRKDHDELRKDQAMLTQVLTGDPADPKNKPGLVTKVDRIMTTVQVLLVLVSVGAVLMPAVFWLIHVAGK